MITMKISRLLTIALLCSGSTIMAGAGDNLNLTNGYVADGVAATFVNGVMSFGKTELQASNRFYDSQKGWVADSRYGDSLMCWAHTASNMIQYWQSYYGVFYKGDTALPYGSDYKRELYNVMNPSNSPVITDPMRLNVMKALKDSGFPNSGNEVASGTNWFFTWVDSQGGYYSDYFGAIHNGQSNAEGQTATITGINSVSGLKSALLPALGITETNGSYRQTEAGLIAHLNVTNGTNPHTLTCYGLTTHADGSIKSVIIADSDDCRLPSNENTIGSTGASGTYTPKLSQLYTKTDSDGKIMLYSDESCETPFISGYAYYVAGVTQINTPEVLKNMLAEYSDTVNEAQVWNGSATEWTKQQATTEQLPTAATGWDVQVNGDNIAEEHRGYYHTYATDGRRVLFDDHAAEDKRSISIVGSVAAENIEIAAAGYEFKAGENAALQAGADMTVRSIASLHTEVALNLQDLTLESGAELSSDHTITVKGSFHAVNAPTTATFSLRGSGSSESSIHADLDLTGASVIILENTVNMNGHKLRLNTNTPLTLHYDALSSDLPFFSGVGELLVTTTDGKELALAPGTDLSPYLTLSGSNGSQQGVSITYSASGDIGFRAVPEPSGITLSLLALTVLTARRRRSRSANRH